MRIRSSIPATLVFLAGSLLGCGSDDPRKGAGNANGGTGGSGSGTSVGKGGSSGVPGSGGTGGSVGGVGGSEQGKAGAAGATYDADGVPAVLWITLPTIGKDDNSVTNDIPETDVTGKIRIIEAHDGRHANPSAFATLPAALESDIALHVRGNTSASFPKKSYALELHDSAGAQVKLRVLDMPKEPDWVLYGPYNDKTYLRDVLTYWLGREIYRQQDGTIEAGRWNPRTRFSELYINGQYRGVYAVIEKIKADSDRVDVNRPAADASLGDITGGYIIRREGIGRSDEGATWEQLNWVTNAEKNVYAYHYPKWQEITPAQKQYIQGYFDSFESAMSQPGWDDPTTGYRKWLDMKSTVDYCLAMEWTNNIDGYFKSLYFVKQPGPDGKLFLMPFWDFNIALGNADYREGNDPTNWVYDLVGTEGEPSNGEHEVSFVTKYFKNLWSDPAFKRDLRCRWDQLRAGPLKTDTINQRIDAWVVQLADAERRDHQKWRTIGTPLWPNPEPIPGSYAGEIAALKAFIKARFEFLDAQLPGTCN